jgi:hypothetical protein
MNGTAGAASRWRHHDAEREQNMTRATRNATRFLAMVMMISIAIVAHPVGASAQPT